jgi:hypothetical protein
MFRSNQHLVFLALYTLIKKGIHVTYTQLVFREKGSRVPGVSEGTGESFIEHIAHTTYHIWDL